MSRSRRPQTAQRAASISSITRSIDRRLSAISAAEQGQNEAAAQDDRTIHEEIEEIKRYEDFSTIDWVQDAAREQLRRKARRQENASFFQREGGIGWRRKLWESYDAGQAWIVVSLIGTEYGILA